MKRIVKSWLNRAIEAAIIVAIFKPTAKCVSENLNGMFFSIFSFSLMNFCFRKKRD